MTKPSMNGPRLKLERATRHRNELESIIQNFLKTTPYEVGVDDHPESGRRLYRLIKVADAPKELALVAGDAVHNVRSALDLLIWQLIELNGKEPGNRDSFPILKSREEFKSNGLDRVKNKLSSDAIRVLDKAKPYKGGNDALWRIHKLDIADKHRVLFVVGSAFRSTSLPFHQVPEFSPETNRAMAAAMSQIFFRPADRMFPLKVGDVLFDDILNPGPASKIQFNFDVAFDHEEIVGGEPMIETIDTLIASAELTLNMFSRLLQA